MKFTWLHWLVVGLLAVIVCLIIFWPKKEDSAVIQARDSIEVITERNQILAMNARTLELSLVEVKVKAKSDSARFYREITVKNQQLAKKRVVVQHIIDTIPELKEFVETADNVIEMQRQRIDSLEAEKAFQASLYDEMIYIQNKQIGNLNMVIGQKDLIIGDQGKTIKKSRRGNKLLKVALPIAVVGVLVLSQ